MGYWRTEAVSAVEEELRLTPDRSDGKWRSLGRALQQPEPGWYAVDLRGEKATADNLDQLCLAGSEGPDSGVAVPVEASRLTNGILRLRVAGTPPPDCRYAWTARLSLRHLLERLRDGIRDMADAPLADALAAGRLDPIPAAGPSPDGLLGPQQDAYRSCLARGVRMVWGPPGTGKTLVLARAIEDLIRDGKRVLLVSTANVAVDNALAEVVRRLKPAPGVVVRVGPPHLPELAEDENVQLHRLAAQQTRQADEQRQAVQQQLADLTGMDELIDELEDALDDYDHNEYLDAVWRIANAAHLEDALAELAEATDRREATTAAVETAQERYRFAESEWQRIDPQRMELDMADRLAAELTSDDHRLSVFRARVHRDRVRTDQQANGLFSWWRRRSLQRLETQLADYEAYVARRHADGEPLIAACQQRAYPITRDEVNRRFHAMQAATQALRDAHGADAEALRWMQHLQGQVNGFRVLPLADDNDREFVRECEAQGRPAQYVRYQELLERQRLEAAERGRLEQILRDLTDRCRALRRDAEGMIIAEARMIATTLARSRAHRVLAEQRFDVVLVDEAGAARLAEVLLAVSRATHGAVLLGDFLQLGPVVDARLKKSVLGRKWLAADAFTHCQIRRPEDALTHSGCVALVHQFRFGPTLRQLANDVVYDVLQDGAALTARPKPEDTRIVVVDVSGLPDLAVVHRRRSVAGWWAVGALLSRALAEHHLPDGDGVGVVTTFRQQAEATLAAVRDASDGDLGVDVGTVHSFQGREFGVVIFDLVEDGGGWIIKSDPKGDDWQREGVRLFGVGITRARRRLYLVTRAELVRAAPPNSSLAALNRLRMSGGLAICRAEMLLGLDADDDPRTPNPVEAELGGVLREFIQVTDIADEVSFRGVLAEHLAAAEQSVWMWSPWIGNRAFKVLPLIDDAVRRGVDVRVFLRTDSDANMRRPRAQEWLGKLHDTGARVIRADVEHRKVVVIDGRVVLLGSYNPLSQGVSREIMLTCRGQAFARRLLAELQAEELGNPPRCASCRCDLELRRYQRRQADPWSWRCPGCHQDQAVRSRGGGRRSRTA